VTLDPARVFATLGRHGVDYVTIGAFAVIAHGYVRATADIDFVARQDRDNLERLAAAFVDLDARLRGIDADLLDIDPTDPDVLPTARASPWTRMRGRSTTSTMFQARAPTTISVPAPSKPMPQASWSAWSGSTTSSA
jgi:hypothetical protein